MFELVLANLRTRPFRTLISVVGVALGVVLIVLFTGLARGMTEDLAKRSNNWKAEIVFMRPGSMDMTSSTAKLSTTYAERLLQIEGVQTTTPVYKDFESNPDSRWGLRQIDGVDFETYAAMNDLKIVSGRAPSAINEIAADENFAKEENLKTGGETEIYGKKYTIAGIYSPPSGARIKMTLAGMQDIQQNPNKCTFILVKVREGAAPVAVAARINETLPGNQIDLTEDLIANAKARFPALDTFLRVLVGLGAFVSMVFVLLSMYTTVTERRKEIGILKSLGASKGFIIRVIESEAFLIGIFGVLLGLFLSFVISVFIQKTFDLVFQFSAGWIVTAVIIAVAGSLFGALYPAWKASSIDPVNVMVNE